MSYLCSTNEDLRILERHIRFVREAIEAGDWVRADNSLKMTYGCMVTLRSAVKKEIKAQEVAA